jgi:hypothetical protein
LVLRHDVSFDKRSAHVRQAAIRKGPAYYRRFIAAQSYLGNYYERRRKRQTILHLLPEPLRTNIRPPRGDQSDFYPLPAPAKRPSKRAVAETPWPDSYEDLFD